ncbi:hypothetical protein ACFLQZ_02420 [Acidobacteriota bacterium]
MNNVKKDIRKPKCKEHAFVTILYGDKPAWLEMAMAMGYTLKTNGMPGEAYRMILLAVDVPKDMTRILHKLGFEIRNVEMPWLEKGIPRPPRAGTFAKLLLWNMLDLKKLVFLDTDTMILSDITNLFESPDFSVVPFPDVGEGYLNTGVFVTEPSSDTYEELMEMYRKGDYPHTKYDSEENITEQDLLIEYFSVRNKDRLHLLPEKYNFRLWREKKMGKMQDWKNASIIHGQIGWLDYESQHFKELQQKWQVSLRAAKKSVYPSPFWLYWSLRKYMRILLNRLSSRKN